MFTDCSILSVINSINSQTNLSIAIHLLAVPHPTDEKPAETKQPRGREPLLVRMAKILGLAVAVLVVGTVFELITAQALPFASFRSGMGFAYLCGGSVLIAFSSSTHTWYAAANRAALVCVVGLLAWLALGASDNAFDVACGLTGVWYTIFIRRF